MFIITFSRIIVASKFIFQWIFVLIAFSGKYTPALSGDGIKIKGLADKLTHHYFGGRYWV